MKRIIFFVLCSILLVGCVKNDIPVETGYSGEVIYAPIKIDEASPSGSAGNADSFGDENRITLPFLKATGLPKIDGSTATIPLGEALVSLLLDIPRSEAAGMIDFNGTHSAYVNLIYGERDLVIAYEPTDEAVKTQRENDFEWELAPIGRDALVFLVNASNPVENITMEQARKIYIGEITNWKELGGNDLKIEPFQRNADSGSQTLFLKLIMKGAEPMKPDTKYIQGGMMGLVESVASFNETGAAIGYSVYYYAKNMNPNNELKFLKIDDVEPNNINIQNGSYLPVNNFYAAISKTEPTDSAACQIFNWLQSDEGKTLIENEGYVPVID
ncbi:MAG: substrate-binding domain-containing protein [Eubacterium sp.]|jgi:phosphate transport system substrate-binding protein|nr:substrate-binding domain-containing protein [Eubacterium sp.]